MREHIMVDKMSETTPGTKERLNDNEIQIAVLQSQVNNLDKKFMDLEKSIIRYSENIYKELQKLNGYSRENFEKVDRGECHDAMNRLEKKVEDSKASLELKIKESEKSIKWFFAICTTLITALLISIRIF